MTQEEKAPLFDYPTNKDSYHYYLDIAGVMAAPYLRESYLDIASRIASALLLHLC